VPRIGGRRSRRPRSRRSPPGRRDRARPPAPDQIGEPGGGGDTALAEPAMAAARSPVLSARRRLATSSWQGDQLGSAALLRPARALFAHGDHVVAALDVALADDDHVGTLRTRPRGCALHPVAGESLTRREPRRLEALNQARAQSMTARRRPEPAPPRPGREPAQRGSWPRSVRGDAEKRSRDP